MATRRRGKLLLTNDEFIVKMDMEGGLMEATFGPAQMSYRDLRDKDTELYKAMRTWDLWKSRGAKLESAIIDAISNSEGDHNDEPN